MENCVLDSRITCTDQNKQEILNNSQSYDHVKYLVVVNGVAKKFLDEYSNLASEAAKGL